MQPSRRRSLRLLTSVLLSLSAIGSFGIATANPASAAIPAQLKCGRTGANGSAGTVWVNLCIEADGNGNWRAGTGWVGPGSSYGYTRLWHAPSGSCTAWLADSGATTLVPGSPALRTGWVAYWTTGTYCAQWRHVWNGNWYTSTVKLNF